MDLNLKDKVALVAGGSLGLGRAVALLLSREGAKVAISALDDPKPAGSSRSDQKRNRC